MSYTNSNLTGMVNFFDALKLVTERFNSSSACHHIVVVFTDQFSDKIELRNALEVLDSDNMVCMYSVCCTGLCLTYRSCMYVCLCAYIVRTCVCEAAGYINVYSLFK